MGKSKTNAVYPETPALFSGVSSIFFEYQTQEAGFLHQSARCVRIKRVTCEARKAEWAKQQRNG